ncbi:MAG: Ig-like domain-containing protein, partial [Actinomycetia bacterium]|nr:Ig-like domain-containing protein [Actinomycetes bacterium]
MANNASASTAWNAPVTKAVTAAPLVVSSIKTQATKGTCVVAADKVSVTYTPSGNGGYTDTCDFVVTDPATALTATATLTITVGAKPDAPVATNASASTAWNAPVTTKVTSDPLVVSSVATQPAHGTCAVAADAVSVTYTPSGNGGFTDTCVFVITDPATTLTAQATLTVTVSAGPPAATDATASTGWNAPVTTKVTSAPLQVSSIKTQATHGTCAVAADKVSVTYTPSGNGGVTDSCVFVVTDPATSLTATATLTVTVAAKPASVAAIAAFTVAPAASGDVPADGVAAWTGTVTLKDQFGDPVTGAASTLTWQIASLATPPAGTATASTPVDRGDGTYTVSFTSHDAGQYQVTPGLASTGPVGTLAKTIVFTTGPCTGVGCPPLSATLGLSADHLTVTPGPCGAPGTVSPATVTATVVVTDVNNNRLSDVPVTFAVDGSLAISGPATVNTGTNGAATVSITVDPASALAGAYHVTASADGVNMTGTPAPLGVLLIGTTVETLSLSAMTAVPTSGAASVPADGTSSWTISVTATDACTGPVSGLPVSFAATPDGVLSAGDVRTDADGVATVTVTDETVQTVLVSASAAGTLVTGISPPNSPVSVAFAAVTPPAKPTGVAVVTLDNQPAGDGQDVVTVTVTGPAGPVAGAVVSLAADDPAVTVQPGIDPTGADGTTTAWVSASAPGTYAVAVAVEGLNGVDNSPVMLSFVAAAVPAPVVNGANVSWIAGTAPLGASVEVTYPIAGGTNTVTVPVDESGAWTLTTPADAVDGELSVVTIAADGRRSEPVSATLTLAPVYTGWLWVPSSPVAVTPAACGRPTSVDPATVPGSVSVTDQDGYPAAGIVVDVSADAPLMIQGPTRLTTDINGEVNFTMTVDPAWVGGVASASVNASIGGVPVDSSPSRVRFSTPVSQMPPLSSVVSIWSGPTAGPGAVAADGTSSWTVTVASIDLCGLPAPDVDVQFSTTGNAALSGTVLKTGADGMASVQVTDLTAEEVGVTAMTTYYGYTLEVPGSPQMLTFVAPPAPVSATSASAHVSTDGQWAGGAKDIVTVSVQADGAPAKGAWVTATADDPRVTVQPQIAPTGADGTTTVWFTASEPGDYTVAVSATGVDGMAGSPLPVHFIAAPPAAPMIQGANGSWIGGTAPAAVAVEVTYPTAGGTATTTAPVDASGAWLVPTPADAVDGMVSAVALGPDGQASGASQFPLSLEAPYSAWLSTSLDSDVTVVSDSCGVAPTTVSPQTFTASAVVVGTDGHPAAGVPVTFTVDSPLVIDSAATVASGEDGVATITVRIDPAKADGVSQAGVRAVVDGTIMAGSPARIGFTTQAPPVPPLSQLTSMKLSPTVGSGPVAADGTSSWTITVTAVDNCGVPQADVPFAFAVTGDATLSADTVNTGADGVGTVTLTDTTPETVSVGGTVTYYGYTVPLAGSPMPAVFTEPQATPTYTGTLTLSTDQLSVTQPSCGDPMTLDPESLTATVTVVDQDGKPAEGVTVDFAAAAPLTIDGVPSVTSGLPSVTTGPDGKASVTLRVDLARAATTTADVTASIGGVPVDGSPATVSVVLKSVLPAGPGTLTVSAAPTAGPGPVAADGDASWTVTVLAADGCGTPATDVPVSFAVTGGAMLSADAMTTDADGRAVVTVTDATAESVDVSVSATPSYTVTGSPVSLDFAAVAPVYTGTLSTSEGAIIIGTGLCPDPLTPVASSVTVTVQVVDADGMPAAGVPVDFAVDAPAFIVGGKPTVKTDTAGVASVEVSVDPATAPASFQVSASIGGVSVDGAPQTIVVHGTGALPPPSVVLSTSSVHDPVTANGRWAWNVTALVTDVCGTPLPGSSVTFTASG